MRPRYIYFRNVIPEVVYDNRGNGQMRSADPNAVRRKRRSRKVPKQPKSPQAALPPSRVPTQANQPRNYSPQAAGALATVPKARVPKQPTRALPPARSLTLDQAVGPRKKTPGGALAVRGNQNTQQRIPSVPGVPNSLQNNRNIFPKVHPLENNRNIFPKVETPQQSNITTLGQQNNGGYIKNPGGRFVSRGKTAYRRIDLTGNRSSPTYRIDSWGQRRNPRLQQGISNVASNVTKGTNQGYQQAKKWVKQKGLRSLDILNKAYRRVVR
jgi:hypothetical protein